MDYFICHYHEIGLKGGNRRFFEEKLVENIKKALPARSFEFVKRISGRIIIKSSEERIRDCLKNVFGLAYFAQAFSCKQDMDLIKQKTYQILKKRKFKTFKISTQRSKKDFPLTSQQVNEEVGEYILEKSKAQSSKAKIRVDLENPDLTCFIEIVDKYVFLYLEKVKGPGGLPVTSGGKAVALLSGGIDSPVAAFRIMKRGIKVVFLHFHAYPYTNKASIEKVQKIARLLNKYQFDSKLYLVPFAAIQKEILTKAPERLRVLLYRRMMLRVAESIAGNERAQALVTGENLGQVASQTLENLGVIEKAADLSILRPLLAEDKEEIINSAKTIGTFDISILPDQDCCARFLPKHPATRASLEEVEKAEKKINTKKLVKAAVSGAELKKI
ncbi:MAG: tRNA 4-thiouridine(8) synthase ThiI [Candidatus Nealsonbacteria bacterium]|nr:MAG: tRNA 4-thiouridine(8) synthase ThiI [Candidatus Nealsonbacteria bacterium]